MIHYLRILAAKLRGLLGKRKADRELDDEIEMHLRLLTERYVRQGMNEAEAASAARRQFGNITLLQEVNREMRGIGFIETLLQDLRYGLWMLRRNPGFTFVAVLTLALGIGANTAIFSVVNAVLLRPLPYYDPHRLVYITGASYGMGTKGVKGGNEREELSGAADYIHWKAESKTFDHMVLFHPGQIYLTDRGEPERLNCVRATANLFPALGVAPQLGRAFTPDEDRPGGEPVVILSHALWQRRFGGDPAIIGQSLTLDGRSRQVIGVMPPGFKFLSKADVLLPRALNVQQVLAEEGMRHWGSFMGRLKPGVSVEQARSELDTILQRIRQANPNRLYAERALVTPLGERLVGNLRRGLLVLFGAVAFILLIACANVANLMLARGAMRQREMAIRAAIGAGRGRLIRQMLTESLLLSVLGGIAGFLLALLGIKALIPLVPDDLAHLKNIGIDAAALGFTFFAALLTGVIAGIIPALQASRVDLNESLKEGVGSAAFSMLKGARRVTPALMIGELALTLALLAGAGLLIKSFLQVRVVEPGYNPENLLTMEIPIYTAGYQPAQKKLFYQDLLRRINALPGVKIAAIGPLPLNDMKSLGERPKEVGVSTCCFEVSADYFRAMGIQLRAGRSFTELENENAPHVIVINETHARQRFRGEDPIGKRVIHGFDNQREVTIVGVAADVKRFGLESGIQDMEEYLPVLQRAVRWNINLVVRTEGNPLNLAPAVRQQVWAINPNLPVVDVMSMEQRLAESVAPRRFQMLLLSLFAAVALVIAAVGIYGVISYAVSRRTQEIGIRMALGAQASDVLRMVVWRALSFALIGVVLGLAASLALTRVMKNLLFNVSATDPAIFAIIALLLIGVALIASYIPARRATKVDPLQALRHE
jgi:putative ABC transport system permease protein